MASEKAVSEIEYITARHSKFSNRIALSVQFKEFACYRIIYKLLLRN